MPQKEGIRDNDRENGDVGFQVCRVRANGPARARNDASFNLLQAGASIVAHF
jgi:hypothetical protein